MKGLGLLIALTALAAAGRLLLLAVPNVALTFLVVAVAGLAYGPRMGAAVGGLSMALTSAMLGGPTPGALAGAGAAALLGGLAGTLRGAGFPGPHRLRAAAAAGALGFGFQMAFSASADAAGWALFAWLPQGAAAEPLLLPILLGGLAFNVPAALFQAALFAGTLGPILEALRGAGLAPGARRAEPRPDRVAVVAEAMR